MRCRPLISMQIVSLLAHVRCPPHRKPTGLIKIVAVFIYVKLLDKNIILCALPGAYNETRQCVRSCVPSDEQMAHVRPFFRRNYLNEMLCIKHYDGSTLFSLPCF
uniref:Secreted protein n=1 Tax=Ascaris lumbricoides TaxID=6252 RepID=A0A0M3IQV8_ASCLU